MSDHDVETGSLREIMPLDRLTVLEYIPCVDAIHYDIATKSATKWLFVLDSKCHYARVRYSAALGGKRITIAAEPFIRIVKQPLQLTQITRISS